MGLPCAHTLMRLLRDDGVVLPSMFHRHWHLDTFTPLDTPLDTPLEIQGTSAHSSTMSDVFDHDEGPADDSDHEEGSEPLDHIRNPPIAPLKGRPRFHNVQRVYAAGRRAPRAPTSQASTQRNPSAFEHVEGVARRPPRCSLCKRTGHNRQRCPRTSEDRAAVIEVEQET